MTIRYKADHRETREVKPFENMTSRWVGEYGEVYFSSDWEPVPEKRWVKCELELSPLGSLRVGKKWFTFGLDERATIIAPGTVRFEREEA